MAGEYAALVNEIAVLAGEGHKVTICTATEKVTFSRAGIYDFDVDVVEGRSVDDRGILIHGSAIQVVYIDEADDE